MAAKRKAFRSNRKPGRAPLQRENVAPICWTNRYVEELESRRLLAVLANSGDIDNQIWDLPEGSDQVEIRFTAPDRFVIDSKNDTFDDTPFMFSGTSVTINLGDGADEITINDLSGTAIVNKLKIAGGGGADKLTGPAENSTWSIVGPGTGSVGGVAFSNFENLQGAAENEDRFNFYAAGRIVGTVDGGAGGNDSLSLIDGHFTLVTFTAIDSQVGTIRRDSDLIIFRGLEPATDSTSGAKLVTDSTGASNITVLEIGPTVAVSGNNFPETFVFTDPDSVTIDAGTGIDRVTIQSDITLPGTVPLTVNAGDENDVVILNVATPQALFSLFGDAGEDTVVFSSTLPTTITDVELRLDTQAVGAGTSLSSFSRAVIKGSTLNKATFTGQVIFTAGVPDWVEQGPGPVTGGQARINPDQPVTGAIHTVAVHPADLSSMYIGTANGGVWKNSDISVLFEFDQTVLTANAQARLVAFANFLKANPTLTVNIVGHTDSDGDQVTVNQPLSESRALAVKNFLIGEGIDTARLTDSGQGELSPVDTNTTADGKAHNRRVELIVNHWVPLTDQFPSLAISSLTISPFDADGVAVNGATPQSKLVLFAGTGAVTSGASLFSGIGAASSIGILKSTDGGTTWKLLDSLRGGRVEAVKVLPNGDLLVGTDAKNATSTGLFRSVDGGSTFIDINAALTDGVDNDGDGDVDPVDTNEGVPAVPVTDIALDPGNPLRAYAGLVGQGVFVTNDGGLSWDPMNTGIPDLTLASRLVFSVSAAVDAGTGNHPVYVATIGKANRLTGVSAAGTLTIQVPANTVVEAGDTIALSGGGADLADNDGLNGIDDAAEAALQEHWTVASVGAIAGGNRIITLNAANADGIDNDRDRTTDVGAEVAVAAQGLFFAWGVGATVTTKPGLSSVRLSGVFRTDTNGANWVPMPLPGSNETNGFFGIHPGAQARNHFSMAADPLDPEIVYVGGDRQVLTPNPNSLGSNDFTGRLFRGNASTNVWQSITDNSAANTAPHADSRRMEFRGLHIVEVDDGGIYELRNPGTAGRVWESANDNLGLSQLYSVAFDTTNNVILGGTQDTGSALQSATNAATWNSIDKGDGTIVQFNGSNPHFSNPNLGGFTIFRTPILNAPAAGSTTVIVAGGSPVVANDRIVLGGFFKTVQSVAATVPADGTLTLTLLNGVTNALPIGSILTIRPQLNVVNTGATTTVQNSQFVNPFVLNSITPNNLLIGTHFVYESTDSGRNLTRLATASGGNNIGKVKPMIYGGRQPDGLGGFTNNADLIFVGTDPGVNPNPAAPDDEMLWVRLPGGGVNGALAPITNFKTEVNAAVVDIAIDPNDWHNLFVLDANGDIWFSPNAGQTAVFPTDAGPNTAFWKKLSSDLSNLPGTKLLQQIAVSNVGGTLVLLATGQGGVFRSIAQGPWHQFGEGLPKALTTAIEPVGGASDLLLAGTFGRGAWTIPSASQSLAIPGTLTMTGTDGDDVFILQRSTDSPWRLDVFQFLDGEPQPALPSFSVPFLSLASISLDGGLGDDRFVIDASTGAVVTFPTKITIKGGEAVGDNDRLEIIPPADPNAVSFDSGIVGSVSAGSHVSFITDAFTDTLTQTVIWTELEAVNEAVDVEPVVDVVGTGLDLLADAFNDSMRAALQGVNIPGIDAQSLASALNGFLVESLTPQGESFVAASGVPGSDQVQVDNGKSVLLRILEAGGLNLDAIGTGVIPDAAALELKLESLDNTADNVSLSTADQPFDSDLDDDLLFDVHVVGVVLKGVLDLDVESNILGGLGSVALTGLLDVEMTLDLSLSFGVDSTGFFIRTSGPVLPKLKVTNLGVSGDAIGGGRLGFIEIDVNQATLALDPGVELVFDLHDPGTHAADNLIRAPELSPPDPRDLISFTATTDGDAVDDLVIDAQVEVSAILPGMSNGISLAEAGIKLSWASIATPTQVVVTAGANPGSDVAHFLRFLEMNVQDFVDQLTSLQTQLDAVVGVEVPFLSDGLTALVDFATAFQERVIDPISGAGGGLSATSVQSLARKLADSLGISPAALGLAYDAASTELTYHLNLNQSVLNETKQLGSGLDFADGLADLQFSTTATIDASLALDVIFGLDVAALITPGSDPLDWFFIRNPIATAAVSLDATDIEASARFGFVSIGVDEGTLNTGTNPIALSVSLTDPGTNAADGRIDLRELVDGLDDLGTLVSADVSGSLDLFLPVEVPFLNIPSPPLDGDPNTPADPNFAITVHVPDLTDPSTWDFQVGAGLQDMANFANIDAASLVGLIGQLTFWLDEFRKSDQFKSFDVPLVGPALDKILGFADSFRDRLLFDDADDGIDANNKLIVDLNAALDDAGLGARLRAENSGGKIRLIANDAAIDTFVVTAAPGNALGFGALQTSTPNVFESLIATNAAPATGVLLADVTFSVSIDGGPAVNVLVSAADTTNNTSLGNDRAKLVDAQNAASFATVDEMVLKLTEILGIPGLAYNAADETLTFTLNLSDVFGQKDFPIDFALDNLPDFLTLETGGVVRISADGSLNLTLGVYLGDAPSSSNLDGAELLTELNGGIDIATEQRITGATDVRTVYGQLSADANFSLSIDGAPAVPVTILKTATDNNLTAADLATDINAALTAAALGSQIVAVVDGLRIVLQEAPAATLASVALTAANSNPAVKDIGFAASQSAVDDAGILKLKSKDLVALRGRLTGDAAFSVSLNTVNGGAPVAVNIPAANTATNRFAFDIVNDVQGALEAIPSLSGKIEVGYSNGRMTFAATDGATSFTITAGAGNPAVTELGLATSNVGNSVDFTISLRDGSVHGITLDGLTTLNQVLTQIGTQTSGKVSAAINADGTGLNLEDNSIPSGGNIFAVQVANNSTAAIDLGILRADAQGSETPDGLIEGADIGGLTPLDRFFIENASANVGVHLSTPTLDAAGNILNPDGNGIPDDGLSGTAKFGFVGINVSGGGTVDATLSLGLTDPGTVQMDGRISLRELLDALDDLGTLIPAPALVGGGSILLDVTMNPALPGLSLDPNAQIGVIIHDLGDPFSGQAPDIEFVYPNLDNLLDFGNTEFNFQNIIAGLRALTDFLDDFESFDFLSKPLPLVGVSVNDLIDVADRFGTAIDDAQANPAGTVQFLERKLEEAFGLPPGSPLIDLLLVHDDNDTVDTSDDFDILKIELSVSAGFSETLGVDFDLGLPIDLGGAADLAASGTLSLDLDIGFRVDDPTQIYIFDSTGLDGTLNIAGTGLTFRAAVGPMGVFIDGGTADIQGTLGGKLFEVGLQNASFVNNRSLLGDLDLSTDFSAQIGGAVAVALPVFFPTDSIRAGTVFFDAALTYDSGSGDFSASATPRAEDETGSPIDLAELFAFDPSEISLLDQLLLGVDGVDLFLEGLQDILDGEIGGVSLPLIGDKLAGTADVIGDFRNGFIEDFRQAIQDLANPTAAFNQATSADPISKILFDLLGPGGLNLLLDSGDAGSDVTVADITYVSNISTPGVPLEDTFLDWDFKLGSTLVNAGGGIGFDVGIPGLGLETKGSVNLTIDWELAFGFGLSYDDGFYLDIADESELELNVDVTVPGAGITGTLGFLQLSAEDDTDDGDGLFTHLGATFGVDIYNKTNPSDSKLGFSELGRIAINAGIAAEAVVDLGMVLSLSSDLVPSAPTNFPSIVADFTLNWGVGNRNTGELIPLGDLDGSFLKNGLQFVGFENVGLDLGSYLSDLIGPIAHTIQDITDPIKPFLDFITEPIPVISDLAGPTSILDIAAMSGLVNPGIIAAIDVIDQVVDIANSVASLPSGNAILYFDDFLPSLVIYEAPASGPVTGIDLTNPNLDLDALADQLLAGLDFLPEELQNALGDVASGIAENVKKMLPGGGAASGFSLPIIDDPGQVFGMLMGQPAVLVQYDMAPLELEAEFSAFFSIFGPLGVSINAEFAAQFGPFQFGYDTFGITQFASSGFRNPLLLFDGFFVGDFDAQGNDIPELQFDAGLWAAAELNLGIARGGVGGGLFAEIDFDLHDPNRDGRVRIEEIVTNVLNEFRYGEPALSPLAVFDITGKLTAELFAFLKIDIPFFPIDEKFQITDPITLLDFESNFERFPTLATELGDGVLQLNMGKFADQRIEGELTDGDEEFHVAQDGPTHVKVWAPSLGVDFSEAQTYEVTSTILALGGEGNDTIDLSAVSENIKFELEGNAGDDIIKAGTGTAFARILGGSGNDELWGAGGDDNIFGEAGDDEIHGGGGKDWLFGDGSVKDSIQGNVITVGVKANDGADTIFGDAGEDLIFGAGGQDTLEGGADSDVLIGDAGKVTVGNDRIVVTTRSLLVPPQPDSGRLELAVNDTSKGSKGTKDTLRGDGGNDRLYGGIGDDDLFGGSEDDVIYGETGRDTIDAGDGNDIVFGDFGTFVLVNAQLEPVSITGGEGDTIAGGDGNDKLLGGDGNDAIHGDKSDGTGTGEDWVWGGTGVDTIHGDGGADHLYGNSDPDKLYGDAGDDYLEGGQGNDLLLGGLGNDLLVAGYGSDTLDGEQGSDSYRISARGGSITDTTTAYDTGGGGDTDLLVLIGTPQDDTVLLRAMADYYFPTEVKLIGDASSEGLTDRIFASGDPDKLRGNLQALEDAYGPHDIPADLISDLIDLFVAEVGPAVLSAINSTYVAPPPASTVPALAGLISLLDDPDDPGDPEDYVGILHTESRSKLDEIQKAITKAYGDNPVPATMFDEITNKFNEFTAGFQGVFENAIHTKYQFEIDVLGADTDTAFVALINNGGANVERFNYRDLEGLSVNTLAGNDYVVSDDVIASTTINLGLGEDRAQIGQVFRSERTRDPAGELITGITAEDVFTTIEITRGWLSNGVSRPTTINGGDGNDQFTVFRNVAVLNLNGGDGDDLFTVRAFALKGSTDNERARTDMKGDGGADTILYVVNAPVGIDGGDGFDTVRIVGTEFADDFVVTDEGIFGAGLNVSYINIEKLVADGAEGNDRFFVLSTGVEIVTEIDGGLGSDSFFVGGNPSRAPIPVISNDFKGHSGVILHSVESGDLDWAGLHVEGVSANIGDNEEDFVLVRESDGNSRVVEGATSGGLGWEFDGYGIRLTRKPGPGQVVKIAVVPAGMAPEDEAKKFKDLEFYPISNVLNGPLGAPLGFNALTGVAITPTLTFTTANWDQLQYVRFRAANDVASEGKRFTFVNHTLQNSTDPGYQSAQMLSVKVQMDDDDRDGVIVTPTGRGNAVLEDGFTDSFDVVLSQQPTANVTITMSLLNSQIVLSGPSVSNVAGVATLTFTPANWATRQFITVTGVTDSVVEGFHTDYITFTVASADAAQIVPHALAQIDGDFDLLGPQAIPVDKPTSYVLLPHRPLLTEPITVVVAGTAVPANRFAISGNTLTFLTDSGTPEFKTGIVEASYSHLEAGYDGSFVKDSVVDIYDEDAPTVIIELIDDGSVDVIEGSVDTDQYRVRLSRAPAVGQDVFIVADAVKTRATYGRTANFEVQVNVDSIGDVDGDVSLTKLKFTSANWNAWQTVTVSAVEDNYLDGNDTQVFAPDLQTVNKIRGPLIVEGAAGAGSLSLPRPQMLPWERNILKADGVVQSFVAGSGGGAIESMTVLRDDLDAVIDRLQSEDSTITSIQDLIGKTLEMSTGPGTGVILDPTRPDDVFDRFWLINKVEDLGNGNVKLTLQNPTLVDPGQPNVVAPDGTSEYAITSLSVNFFADEREQVDYLFVYDDDSVADDKGALTSSDGVVREFTPSAGATETMLVETAALQAVLKLDDLTDLNLLVGRRLEVTVGPGLDRAWTISQVVDGSLAGTKLLTLTKLGGGSGTPTDRSEYRVAGGDTHGRITGFGMGANVLFGGRAQPGGISYGDVEVVEMSLGSGNDEVRVDYATNAEDHTTKRAGDFYTQSILNTGTGNDRVTMNLAAGQSGAFALNLQAGDDWADASLSTAPVVIFGWTGADDITGGTADDILFGDIGRVDYVNTVEVEVGGVTTLVDEIVTRLGHSVPANPVNPPVEGSTATTLFDSDGNFATAYGGLKGLMVQAISKQGHVQFRRIVSNTADTITIDRPWDQNPTTTYFYRISAVPENQTDGVTRGPRLVWSIDTEIGDNDIIYAGGGVDTVIGGVGTDTIHGNAGEDLIAGDNARFDYLPIVGNDGPTAISVVQTTSPTLGNDDFIFGDENRDILIGGTGDDTVDGGTGGDIILGDQGTIHVSNGNLVSVEDPGTDGDDLLTGGSGTDLVIGGLGNDTIDGQADADILIGDAAEAQYAADGITIIRIETLDRANVANGIDTIYGGTDDDVIIGGSNSDNLDGGAGRDLIFGDNVLLENSTGSGNAIDPRFRALTGATIYGLDGLAQIAGAFGLSIQPVPGGRPSWSDWTITLDQTSIATHFGNDYVAGGAGDDEIFGQHGDDIIQGDGSITDKVDGNPVTLPVSAARIGGLLVVTASLEDATDGDDYIEGNSGSDVIFGNLGQDDLIGGSSSLFSLMSASLRLDESDLIFGGAGTDIARNDTGDVSASGHARDADMILGDNGNIFRLVGTGGMNSGNYLAYNYDTYSSLRIIPRAAQLLDYTPGGVDFNPLGAAGDVGANDELHGESGDDFIYGMLGSDVLFGEGQDDDLIAGSGNDWISGGSGDDGILGDDGRFATSRNGATEPLAGVIIATAQSFVKTGGGVQQADINVTGQLKKAANLTPFSQDPAWNPATDEFGGTTRGHADDIIFGGWGNDFLHGGSGDDAISGAESLAESYAPTFASAGVPNGRIRIDYFHPVNPGNVLAFNPVDANGKSSNLSRAGEFYLYNEYDPLRKILLDANGAATTWSVTGTPVGGEYFLNFNAAEGPAALQDATKNSDGEDKVFGDLGNDWLVGGTGRDNVYGGFGNDLLNANDDLSTYNSLNDQPVTSASYEDRAFGGAGRDVLIANTGGDRLIDWTGEFNSYLVPFAPFGNATVSRTLQPALPEFLYALSASDGADPTRAIDVAGADATRNGEPWGELGLVLQKDAAWKDQHGGPADPQPGNIGGTKRDVLRSANFSNGASQGFSAQVGTSMVVNDRYQVRSLPGGDGVSLFDQSDTVIPVYFEMQATINAVKATGGNKSNAYLIFDWQSNTDFKFAGINIATNKLEIGHRTANGWVVDKSTNAQLKSDTDYVVMLKVNGSTSTAVIGNNSISFTFPVRIDSQGTKHLINEGIVGIACNNASAQIDNLVVQKAPEPITVDVTADFSSSSPASKLFKNTTPPTGTWTSSSDNRFITSSADINAPAINLANVGSAPITPGSLLRVTTTLKTMGLGGVVLDYQGPNYFKYVVLSADSKQIIIGHRTGNAWITDASYQFNVGSWTDYQLGVTMRGGLVNVSVNGAVLLSQIYAEPVTTGGYGLIGRKGVASGISSFDIVQVSSDEGAYAPVTSLLQADATKAAIVSRGDTPSADELAVLLTEAKSRWNAFSLDATQKAKLIGVTLQLADLPGAILGEEVSGAIFVDMDAAGRGWFVDVTPFDDSEFTGQPGSDALLAAPGNKAYGKVDLLTVVMHELGHALGLSHVTGNSNLMNEAIGDGTRLNPNHSSVEAVGASRAATQFAISKPDFMPLSARDAVARGTTQVQIGIPAPGRVKPVGLQHEPVDRIFGSGKFGGSNLERFVESKAGPAFRFAADRRNLPNRPLSEHGADHIYGDFEEFDHDCTSLDDDLVAMLADE